MRSDGEKGTYVVESAELGRSLVQAGVGGEDRPAAFTLIPDNPSHGDGWCCGRRRESTGFNRGWWSCCISGVGVCQEAGSVNLCHVRGALLVLFRFTWHDTFSSMPSSIWSILTCINAEVLLVSSIVCIDANSGLLHHTPAQHYHHKSYSHGFFVLNFDSNVRDYQLSA